MLQTVVHYACHLVVPLLWGRILWGRQRMRTAYIVMLLTMLVDLDHLLATPIFDPDRMSIGFHPLHTYPMIALYVVACFVPYERIGLAWWWRAVAVGLTWHMFTDWQDGMLWS